MAGMTRKPHCLPSEVFLLPYYYQHFNDLEEVTQFASRANEMFAQVRGTYFLRPSFTQPGTLCITVNLDTLTVRHFKVTVDRNGQYCCCRGSQRFSTIFKLLNHHMVHGFLSHDLTRSDIKLTYAILTTPNENKVYDNAQTCDSRLAPTVKSTSHQTIAETKLEMKKHRCGDPKLHISDYTLLHIPCHKDEGILRLQKRHEDPPQTYHYITPAPVPPPKPKLTINVQTASLNIPKTTISAPSDINDKGQSQTNHHHKRPPLPLPKPKPKTNNQTSGHGVSKSTKSTPLDSNNSGRLQTSYNSNHFRDLPLPPTTQLKTDSQPTSFYKTTRPEALVSCDDHGPQTYPSQDHKFPSETLRKSQSNTDIHVNVTIAPCSYPISSTRSEKADEEESGTCDHTVTGAHWCCCGIPTEDAHMPLGWVMHKDKSTGRIFFQNERGETSWHLQFAAQKLLSTAQQSSLQKHHLQEDYEDQRPDDRASGLVDDSVN